MEHEGQIDLKNISADSDKKETIRSEKEQKALLDRAIFITKILGRRSDLVALPSDDGVWAAGLSSEVQKLLDGGLALDEIDPALLEPKVLIYPKEDLAERGEDYILGVNRHEIGHFLYSDYRQLLELQKMAQEQGKNPEDAHTLANAIEDPRVNNLCAGESFRARQRLEGIYHEDMPEVIEKLGQLSPPMQFCFLAISSWLSEFAESGALEKALAQTTSQEAREAFNQALPKIQEAIAEKRGAKAVKIIAEEIWPIYAKLVDDYIENPQRGKNGDQDQIGGSGELESQQEASSGGSKGEESNKEVSEGQATGEESQGGGKAKGSGQGQEGQEGGDAKSWDELSEQEKEQLRQQARECLDKENKEFNREFGPKTMEAETDENGITHYKPKEISAEEVDKFKKELAQRDKEIAENQKRERQARDQRSQELRQQAAGLSERRTGLTEGEQAKYAQYRQEVSAYIKYIKDRLAEIFPPREDYQWQRGRPRGTRITARKIAREVPTGRGLIFEKREIQNKPQAICSILVDVSGSMHWQGAIDLAVKEMIMLTEALNSEEIDFELIAFSDTPEVIKNFGEKVSGRTKKQIIGLLDSGGGGTALGKSVEFGVKRLEKEMRREGLPGFLVVHTDSDPGDDLKSVLDVYQEKMPIIGIGVGGDVSEDLIKQYFGESGRYTNNPINAPREIVDVLKQQFSRYRRRV